MAARGTRRNSRKPSRKLDRGAPGQAAGATGLFLRGLVRLAENWQAGAPQRSTPTWYGMAAGKPSAPPSFNSQPSLGSQVPLNGASPNTRRNSLAHGLFDLRTP